MGMVLWRIDDVCLNTDGDNLVRIVEVLRDHMDYKDGIALCVSLTCPLLPDGEEMAFRREWKPLSDPTVFFEQGRIGIPEVVKSLRECGDIDVYSHGLVHADHRLMSRGAQELSIVLSSCILGADSFVPPFHHWNADTVNVCNQHCIELVRYEDGWSGVEHSKFDPTIKRWYMHPWRWTPEKLEAWFNG